MDGEIRTSLTKKFFNGLPDGVFIISNIMDSQRQPILSEYVLSSASEREKQWRSIVLRGCNNRLCTVFENEEKAIAYLSSLKAKEPLSAEANQRQKALLEAHGSDLVSLHELMVTGLTGQKSMNALRARADEGFLFIPRRVLFGRIKLYDAAQSIVRLKAAHIIKSRHPELTWRLLAQYISRIRFSKPFSIGTFKDEEWLKGLVNLVVDTVSNQQGLRRLQALSGSFQSIVQEARSRGEPL